MKALIASDLHLEFKGSENLHVRKIDGVDFLILAGDIGHFKDHYNFIEECCEHYTVLYVLGNHEYYGQDIQEVRDFWNQVDLPNFYFLDNRSVILNGVRFVGTTLWTDFNKAHPFVMIDSKKSIKDFSCIYVDESHDRRVSADYILNEFNVSFKFIKNTVEVPFDGNTVVITHHAPSLQCIKQKYRDRNYEDNFYFASDLDEFIYENNIHTWVHGHMHDEVDLMIGKTHVTSNPIGYPHEKGKFGSFAYKIIEF